MKLTIRTTVAALAAVTALSLSACGDDSDDNAGGDDATATETSGGEETEGGSEEPTEDEGAGGETQDVFDVGLGDCISNFNAEEQISELTVIPCEEEHDQEVFAVFEVPDGEFPGSDAFEEQVATECVAEFETFVGLTYDESVLEIQWLEPTEDSWAQGDRELVCTVLDPEGPVTGTLEGANR
ncbi:septum formation family protein [Jiangella gansuensis]|uniref:septum formation family protein n=1 Tax=Jiangella gansuensis TaxID=281473 RepID=UPI00146FAF9B|nr:septum formation family protein [Jiangella gansuensis]